jgi:hypothetical protein
MDFRSSARPRRYESGSAAERDKRAGRGHRLRFYSRLGRIATLCPSPQNRGGRAQAFGSLVYQRTSARRRRSCLRGSPAEKSTAGFSVRADLVGPIRPVYVALAERERCERVTADTRMVATLKPIFSFIIDLASLP